LPALVVIATFDCGPDCEAKSNTVVVESSPGELEGVLEKLSKHSCFYQSDPKGYVDLVIVEGRIIRLVLTPDYADEQSTRALAPAEFAALWEDQDDIHQGTAGSRNKGTHGSRAHTEG